MIFPVFLSPPATITSVLSLHNSLISSISSSVKGTLNGFLYTFLNPAEIIAFSSTDDPLTPDSYKTFS